MGIQNRDYYQDPYLNKNKKTNFYQKIFIWIIIVIMIVSLVVSLIPIVK